MRTQGHGLEFDPRDARLAAAAWSRIAEPADEMAGTLVAAMGASAALEWLSDQAGGTFLREPIPPALAAAVERWSNRLPGLNPEKDLAELARIDGRLVIPGGPEWPTSLGDLGATAPFALWVRGPSNLAQTMVRSIALVGSRAATSYGESVCAELAVGLADRDFTVCSGGAYGIDGAAHRAALATGGSTIAVLAGGVDRYYPAGNTDLLRRIAQEGLLVAEMPPASAPMRQRFLSRNRLLAAITGATVVVEAAWRSGALSTARHAAALFRPLGAVPGPVTSMSSAGCHQLLRDGVAVCVTDAAEVAELAGSFGTDTVKEPGLGSPPVAPEPQPLLADLDEVARQVLDALPVRRFAPVAALASDAACPLPEVVAALGTLESRGLAKCVGARWRRAALPAAHGASKPTAE